MVRPRALAGGFTLVELVAVVLLLGILAVAATSRLVRDTAFVPAIVTQELVALSRFGQQLALSRRDATVSLQVARDGAEWHLQVVLVVSGVATPAREERIGRANTSIVATNGADSVVLDADPLVLAFDTLGGIDGASVGAVTFDPGAGIALEVDGDASYGVCFGPTGHAYRGACS